MAKKAKPSLKGYLKTGKVCLVSPESQKSSSDQDTAALKLLENMTEADRKTWEPIFSAGTKICKSPLEFVSAREDFRTMDRARFTYYILEQKGGPLRPIRSSEQIREPLLLLLKWDEMGTMTLYDPAAE